jgi:hypothetical protein
MNITAAKLKMPGKADGFLRLIGFSCIILCEIHKKYAKHKSKLSAFCSFVVNPDQ